LTKCAELNDIEAAKKQPSLDVIFKLATAFECDYSELIQPVWDEWHTVDKIVNKFDPKDEQTASISPKNSVKQSHLKQ